MARIGNGNSMKAAVVQAGAIPFDTDACVDKAARLIGDAATQGAKVIVFPEAFIPGYPKGLDFDVTGHYARPDVFQLTVNEQEMRSVTRKP